MTVKDVKDDYSEDASESKSCPLGRSTRVRVLIVAPSIDILGGQAVQAERLLEGLRLEPSLRVDFLPINPRLPGALRRLQSVKYLRTIVTSIAYVLSLLYRVRRYDIIHIFSASYFSFLLAPTPALIISKLYGKRTLLNYHSGHAADHFARWRRTALPIMKLSDLTIVQSNYLVDVFADFGMAAQAIPNHLDLDQLRFRRRTPLQPVFLSNRNLEPRYNVGCVLRAFALIQNRWPEASLRVVGDGTQRDALKSLANTLKLKNTSFEGLLSPEEMARSYDACDIYMNGSEVDSMPLSILEAFACGLPVVTTDGGGIPYMVKNGETALVVSIGDHTAMANFAVRLLDDEQFAANLICRARTECEKYSWSQVRRSWLLAYSNLVQDRTADVSENVAEADRNIIRH